MVIVVDVALMYLRFADGCIHLEANLSTAVSWERTPNTSSCSDKSKKESKRNQIKLIDEDIVNSGVHSTIHISQILVETPSFDLSWVLLLLCDFKSHKHNCRYGNHNETTYHQIYWSHKHNDPKFVANLVNGFHTLLETSHQGQIHWKSFRQTLVSPLWNSNSLYEMESC